jgi:riboflavin kinase/FMN adenylyltransferase
MPKRASTNLSGILAIDKPLGITSHDVVYKIRKATGEKRVGHCGTLDPLASGLMLVCVGPATRLSPYLTAKQKSYQARISFGSATNTDDAEGQTVCTCQVPDSVADPAFAQEFLNGLVGKHQQTPPAFSAIKKDGVRAYKAARNGQQLGTCAHLSALRRTACGNITLPPTPSVHSDANFIDPVAALGLPALEVNAQQAKAVSNGMTLNQSELTQAISTEHQTNIHVIPAPEPESSATPDNPANLIALTHNNKLLALYKQQSDGNLHPQVVIPGGVDGMCQKVGSFDIFTPMSFRQSVATRNLVLAQEKDSSIACGSFRNDMIGENSSSPLKACCAIGAFDGVHAGHQHLINAMKADAASRGVKPVVITFDIDPDELFRPEKVQKLFSNPERLSMLQEICDDILVVPFTRELAKLSWQEFLDQVIATKLQPLSIHVGSNFRFGAKAAGGIEQLQQWAAQHNGQVVAHDLLSIDGQVVCSTRIRTLLAAGDIQTANKLLTRPFRVSGVVRQGAGRGHDLGFATANINQAPDTAQLAAAVSAGYCTVDGQRYKAAISVGEPPTFSGQLGSEVQVSTPMQEKDSSSCFALCRNDMGVDTFSPDPKCPLNPSNHSCRSWRWQSSSGRITRWF